MKRDKIIYWIATGLLSLMMLGSASVYFFKHADAVAQWDALGFPSYPIYFLGVCKVLGIMAILTKKSAFLKEWAYAGFFFNFCLALLANLNGGDKPLLPIIAMVLLFTSYYFDKKVND